MSRIMSSGDLMFRCLILATLMTVNYAGIVKKMIRHRREAPVIPGTHNVTLTNPSQPVVFNHVYNIKVPGSSLCSVDLDTPGGSDLEQRDAPSGSEVTEHTTDEQNQIVFTHRINIPKQACGCKDAQLDLKDLLNRLEMLEGEVSTLREQCSAETTCCSAQATGSIGVKPYCNGHGNYSTETCACMCEPGWKGPNCTIPDCPGDCNDQGQCVDGRCACFDGFTGVDCSVKICPVDCAENGRCVNGVCVCNEGFSGEDCSESDCLNNCLGRGRCVDGECLCDEPWTGFDCTELICPNDCYDRGRCVNGTCYCDTGFTGEDCGAFTCTSDCSGRGFCIDGRCVCDAGYTGDDCSELTCPNNCNERGRCVNGMCICDTGYRGEDCSKLSCPNNCNGRGRCVEGRCECEVGFQGHDCSEFSCPNNCNDRGRCVNGQCVCDEGFAGEDCSVTTCPSNCYGRGRCVDGRCVCYPDFTGEDCSEQSCPSNCLNRGRCVAGQCVCDEGFTGEDCGQMKCPNDCLGRGECVEGRCVCPDGFEGQDCSVSICPGNCNDHGRCVRGKCVCDEGFTGDACSERSCPNNCGDVGLCVDGRCVCDEGYIGEDCSEVSPPKDLSVSDVSAEKLNLTWKNEMLVMEYLITYIPTSPGGLQMDFRVPGDQTSATVSELEPGIEYLINVYAVLNNKKSVPVSARVATHLPKPEGLMFKSVRETSVEVSWDKLDFPFDGWELIVRNTKEENGKVVNSLNPSENSFEQTGLGPGQKYEVTLGIIKNNTRGPQTNATVHTRIDSPGQIEVGDVTDSSAVISWSRPKAEVDGFRVSYGPSTDPSARRDVDLPAINTQYSLEDLKPDTEYRVSLASTRADETSEPIYEGFTTGLDAPRDLQPVAQTDSSILVEWKNSRSSVDGYRIKYGPISGGAHGEEMFSRGAGDKTRATITGLKPGIEYGIGVTAVKNELESEPATTNALTDIDAPRDLEFQSSTETSMNLIWKRPKAKISGYSLTFASPDGRREQIDLPATTTSHTLKRLTPGVQYDVTLVAERGKRKSSPVTLSASTEDKTPSIRSLSISDVSWDSFNVSWTIDEGLDFQSFVIEVANSAGGPERQNLTVSGDALSLWMSGLSPNTSYTIALYGVHQGSVLGPVYMEETTDVSPAAGRLFVSNVTSESFIISWNDTRGDIERFILEIIDSSWLREPVEYNISYNTQWYEITDLRPATDYIVYLTGVLKGRRTDSISTVASTATEPDLFGLVVSNVTSDAVSLSWRTREKAFDHFIVEVRESALPTQAIGRIIPAGERSAVLTGLKGDTQYQIKLYATSGGSNTAAITSVVTTEPEPKLGPIVVSETHPSSFTLSWSVTAGHFDGFVVRITDREQIYDVKELRLSGTERNITVSGLTDSTLFDVVFYGLSRGRQTPSVSFNTSTASLPKVENLTVSDITPYGFRVSWVARSTEGFRHFQVKVSDSGHLLEPQEYIVPGNQSFLDILGLITGIGYEISVTGVSGIGLQSRPITTVAVTEAEPEIEHLFVSDVTPESFRVAWTAEDDLFDRFVLKVRDSRKLSHPREFTVPGDERTRVLTQLMGGTEYEVELYGVSMEHRSQPITAVARTGLGALRDLRFTDVKESSAVVHWTEPRAQPDSYRITYMPIQGGTPMIQTVDGTQSRVQLINLSPGETYQVSVIAVKGLEESEPVTDSFTTALDTPRSLTAVNVTDTTALLLWQPAVATVDEYVITYSADAVSAISQQVSGNTAELQLSSLAPATPYTVTVHAIINQQKSPPANTEFTTDVDAPRDLVASNIQTDSAVLSWKPPRASVTGYILTSQSSDGEIREARLDPSATSHRLSDLRSSTEHTVKLQAFTDDQRSKQISTVFTTVGTLYKNPTDCSQTLLNGDTSSGPYTVYITGDEKQPVRTYCDMKTDEGGWMVILRRQNGKTDFYRNWRNYSAGFGDINDEFWLGLSNLHKITSNGQYELRVDLRDGQETVFAHYDRFYVGEPRTRYKIQIGAYSGTAGDSLSYHNNRPFSTYDNDNDIAVTNCALSYKGAFWYKNCHRVNLMGRYGDDNHSRGINWFHWKGHEHSIPFAEMKIRPVNFRNLEGRRKRS
nr:tenascin isoform X2 [Misgurnus anguillicaudatus]